MKQIIAKLKLLSKSLIKTIFWTGWNTFFGLAPVWVMYFIKSFGLNGDSLTSKFITEKILDKGIILFFCAAIMAAVSIDIIFAKLKYGQYFNVIVTVATCIVLCAVSITFESTFFHKENPTKDVTPDNTYETILYYQNALVYFAGVFCVVLKTVIFYNEK